MIDSFGSVGDGNVGERRQKRRTEGAEAASGQCLVRAFPDLAASGSVLLRSSTVRYRRSATLDTPIVATEVVGKGDSEKLPSQLESRGRAVIDVTVTVTQASVGIFTGVFSWFRRYSRVQVDGKIQRSRRGR